MSKLFFQYNNMYYLYDTKVLKLYRIENKKMEEIKDREIIQNVRLNSLEIKPQQAMKMSKQI